MNEIYCDSGTELMEGECVSLPSCWEEGAVVGDCNPYVGEPTLPPDTTVPVYPVPTAPSPVIGEPASASPDELYCDSGWELEGDLCVSLPSCWNEGSTPGECNPYIEAYTEASATYPATPVSTLPATGGEVVLGGFGLAFLVTGLAATLVGGRRKPA